MSDKPNKAYIEFIPPRTSKSGPKVFKEFLESLEIFAPQNPERNHRLSLHIWKRKETVRFIVECFDYDSDYIIGQMYSYYPDNEINKQTICPFFSDSNVIAHGYLSLESNDIYPLKGTEDFTNDEETSPLNAFLSTIYKDELEEILYTIDLIPLGEKWHTWAKDLAKIYLNLKKGKKLYFSQKMKLKVMYGKANIFEKTANGIFTSYKYLSKVFRGKSEAPANIESELTTTAKPENKKEENLDREVKGREKTYFLSKILAQGFKTSISISISKQESQDIHYLKNRYNEIVHSLFTYGRPYVNKFKSDSAYPKILQEYPPQNAKPPKMYLTNVELGALFYLPTELQKNQPGLRFRGNVTLPPPEDVPLSGQKEVTEIGITRYRETRKVFGILPEDRRRHMYIIGKTGMGKSKLLENMLYDDIQAGRGLAIVDPHGDTADTVLSFVPKSRINDVVLFDPSDFEYPIGFNLLENISPEMNTVVASGIVSIFKKMNANSWGPRLEYILYNTLLSLIPIPNTSLLAVSRIYVDTEYRKYIVEQLTDPVLINFWNEEIGKMQEKMLVESVSPIQNKIGPFLSSPMIRNIVGQAKSSLSIRHIMDNQKIFVCNLSKGKIGELNSAMLGSMLITKFQIDAMGRANMSHEDRKDFYLYVDEFQNFATDAFAVILSEARKYRLNLIVANQYIAQMPEEVKNSVFGNIGTMLNFQIGYDDAVYIANQYEARVTPSDLMGLGVRQAYCRLLINNLPSKVFSLTTSLARSSDLSPSELKDLIQKIRNSSRERFATPKAEVEDKIQKWGEPKVSQSTLDRKEKEKLKKDQKQTDKVTSPATGGQSGGHGGDKSGGGGKGKFFKKRK